MHLAYNLQTIIETFLREKERLSKHIIIYSETCLIQHLCILFPCIIRQCDFIPIYLCFLHCVRHIA